MADKVNVALNQGVYGSVAVGSIAGGLSVIVDGIIRTDENRYVIIMEKGNDAAILLNTTTISQVVIYHRPIGVLDKGFAGANFSIDTNVHDIDVTDFEDKWLPVTEEHIVDSSREVISTVGMQGIEKYTVNMTPREVFQLRVTLDSFDSIEVDGKVIIPTKDRIYEVEVR